MMAIAGYSTTKQQQPCVFEYNSTLISQGEVYTPNYPRPYPNNLNCRYEFYARDNERVIIQVDDFQLEPPQTTSLEDVSFLDFVDTNTRSHQQQQPTTTTVKSSARPERGATNNNNLTDAELLSRQMEQSFSNKQCFYDFLDVFTTDGQGRVYWRSRHCGSSIDPKIVSTSPTLILVLQTDRMLNFRGFKFRFHFSYLNILPLVTEPVCGPSEMAGKGGLLNSPNYPYSFPPNIDCAWTITVEKHERILIKFLDINLNQPCQQSHVSIWDGYVSDVNKPDLTVCEKLRYYHKGIQQYITKTNRLVLKFAGNKNTRQYAPQAQATQKEKRDLSDDEKMGGNGSSLSSVAKGGKQVMSQSRNTPIRNGFKLSWTAVYLDDNCPEFKCKGGEYCIDSKNFLCQETYKYCISNTLVCDGISNCDTGDESDELHCKLTFIQSRLYLFVGLVGAGVAFLSLVVCFIVNKTNKRRMAEHAIEMAADEESKEKLRERPLMMMPMPTFVDDDDYESSKRKAKQAPPRRASIDSNRLPELNYDVVPPANKLYYNSNSNSYQQSYVKKSQQQQQQQKQQTQSPVRKNLLAEPDTNNNTSTNKRCMSTPTYSSSLVSLSSPLDSNSSTVNVVLLNNQLASEKSTSGTTNAIMNSTANTTGLSSLSSPTPTTATSSTGTSTTYTIRPFNARPNQNQTQNQNNGGRMRSRPMTTLPGYFGSSVSSRSIDKAATQEEEKRNIDDDNDDDDEEDGLTSLRRNSYTKAIFYENEIN